jgi:hypothetical protein
LAARQTLSLAEQFFASPRDDAQAPSQRQIQIYLYLAQSLMTRLPGQTALPMPVQAMPQPHVTRCRRMPREIPFFDALIPAILLLLIVSAVLYFLLERLVETVDLAAYVWHPALFRFAVFVILFSSLSLWWYS